MKRHTRCIKTYLKKPEKAIKKIILSKEIKCEINIKNTCKIMKSFIGKFRVQIGFFPQKFNYF